MACSTSSNHSSDTCARVGSGRLVGIASVAGYRGLSGSGVSVITICLGYIDTSMTANNPFFMPFILSAAEMVDKVIRAIEHKRLYIVTPWQMATVARVLRLLPNPLYDRLFAHAPRKPREVTEHSSLTHQGLTCICRLIAQQKEKLAA